MASCIPYSLVSQCTAAPISIPCSVQATQSSPHVFARRTSDLCNNYQEVGAEKLELSSKNLDSTPLRNKKN